VLRTGDRRVKSPSKACPRVNNAGAEIAERAYVANGIHRARQDNAQKGVSHARWYACIAPSEWASLGLPTELTADPWGH
jgi:hypothetical protein